ncbi:hypothetical protein GCM10011380_00380 [Sphingomonas metalli]|uniref:Uncharacterized protein n=1 Tax=Sphingomonas metalli TaxID=1779358 RepID=A0A916SV37_9SPHN|nr:hypothetical protein [Sphingomonas metalli]GGB14898.1 hypothetical protein GCM10011380_00380 [Sphingomonas metalli]
MTQINPTAKFPMLVSREQARNKIADAIRLFVGRGRRYSVKQLSNGTGVPDWQINAALIDGNSPDNRPLPPEALLSVALFLGPVFTSEWLKLSNQGAFDLPDEDEPKPGDVACDTADDAATVTRAAMDGEFCADERKDLRVVGVRMMSRGARLAALGNAA